MSRRRSWFGNAIMLTGGSCALAFGCASTTSEPQEIIDNLVQAGFPVGDIMVAENVVYVGRDAAVSLAASRELLQTARSRSKEQYRTTNLVSRDVRTVCIDPRPCANFSSKFSTALVNAASNYTFLPLTFEMSLRDSGDFTGCDARITCTIDRGAGGSSGFPSGGQPFPTIQIGIGLDSPEFSVQTVQHVMMHELGHTIGFRHSDWFDRSISCGVDGNEGDGGVGAILIPGTPSAAVVGGSVMNSCFRASESGQFTNTDVTALQALYGPAHDQIAYIKASNTGPSDAFGSSVALSGDTLAVGVEAEDSNATGVNGNQADNSANSAGAVYVFVRNGNTWTQQAYLKASNAEANDSFGFRVALSGDTLAVGAFGEASNATGINGNQANNSASRAGAVYVFVRSGTTWTQQAYLKASNAGPNDDFGVSLALEGNTLAVGAPNEASNATGVNGNQTDNSASSAGAVYLFGRSGTTWTQQAYVKASNTRAGASFGSSVALWNGLLAVGAPFERSNATGVNGNQADNSTNAAGAVYLFQRSGSTWSQNAYLKASNTGVNDQFGTSVALSGAVLAVGAIGEASAATGINGNQTDNSANFAGAVYVFHSFGTTWVQQSYLKAGVTGASDQFGVSVAMDGGVLAVGAQGEASAATGVNGNQTDNSAGFAGAAYVFVRDGVTWAQHTYVKASNTDAVDFFGHSVALSGVTLAVGSLLEASSAIGVNGNQSDNSVSGAGAVYVFR